jgi:hypothetical protein
MTADDKNKDNLEVAITIRFSRTDSAFLRAEAERRDRPVSWVVRKLVDDARAAAEKKAQRKMRGMTAG